MRHSTASAHSPIAAVRALPRVDLWPRIGVTLAAALALLVFCGSARGASPDDGIPAPGRHFALGTRVWAPLSSQETEILNSHYACVITPLLDARVRAAIAGPDLYLYRSILGAWDSSSHFDWDFIDAHEEMFEHAAGERILTHWDSWLMDPGDQVPADAPDALDHWVNYFALTAAEQVRSHDYDGLFVDSANHVLFPNAVEGQMPDDYSDTVWHDARKASLDFIKQTLPDKLVIFNGLHTGGGAEQSLPLTDGGMWEVFALSPESGEYLGIKAWYEAISLTERNSAERRIALIARAPGLVHAPEMRVFLVGSYLLVSAPQVYFAVVDADVDDGASLQYFPEYSVDLGDPLGPMEIVDESYAMRRFSGGLVLVNPGESESIFYELDRDYQRVVPVGGGAIADDGAWEGSLDYESVPAGLFELPPVSAAILRVP